MRALARRPHSLHELRQKLAARALVAGDVEPILNRLSNRGWLDDRRFALLYARSRAENRRLGRYRIARELRRKNVPQEWIQEALAEIFPAEADEQALVRQRIERRLRSAGRPPYSQKVLRSLYASLLRAGFPSAIIRDELFRRARIGRVGRGIPDEFELGEEEEQA